MKKILLVIAREYLTRIKKPSFWVLTLVVPLMLAGLYALPLYLASKPMEQTTVIVVDDTGLFQRSFANSATITYRDAGSLDYAKRQLQDDEAVQAIVHIPARETTIPGDAFLY